MNQTVTKNLRLRSSAVFVAVVMLLSSSGCNTLKELAALRDVAFTLDSVSGVELAGVKIDRTMKYDDFGILDLAKLGRQLASNKMPLMFQLIVGATNPEDNSVQARLVKLDWTLLLEDRETISGVFENDIVLPPGQKQLIPFNMELDLIEFFGNNLQDLAELALSLADQGGQPKNVKLRATPTINTPIGPIRYPEPILIVNNSVG
jgi:hypothetical protein